LATFRCGKSRTDLVTEKFGLCEDCGAPVSWITKRRWYCDNCSQRRALESSRRSYQKNTTNPVKRAYITKKAKAWKYGISLEELDSLIDGGCSVCLSKETCIDHDPFTGKIRGALCQADNITAGKLLHDPGRLRRLAEYLENTAIDARVIISGAYKIATKSPDPSTQIGSVLCHIVDKDKYIPIHQTASYNRPVSGYVMQEVDWERPRKYSLMTHSEAGAIFQAGKQGIPTNGLAMITTWGCCSECSQAIVESGISTLIRHHPPEDETVQRWLESVQLGDELMKASGVEVINIYGPIPEAVKVLRGGEEFDPSV